MTSELAEQTIAAHGGERLWAGASEIGVEISAGGFAFASKLQGHAVRGVQARVRTGGQHVVFEPYPRPGQRGVLEAGGTVRIETDRGGLVEARENARRAFSDLRHKLWWDRLDILYFGAYAIWTYVSTPFVFTREDYQVVELDPWTEDGEHWRRFGGDFPPARPHAFPSAGLLFRRERSYPPPRLHRRADRRLGQGRSLLPRSSVIRRAGRGHTAARLPAQAK